MPVIVHGTFDFKIKIGRFTLAQVVGSYTIHITQVSQPVLTPPSGPLPDEVVGQPATGSIAISGGTPPYTLVSVDGLPDGVTAALGADGASVVLSGSPTAPGDASVVVTVADASA